MATFLFANDASSTLASPISSTATSVTLAAGTGALFPSPSAGQQFSLTFNDAATGLLTEIVYCTARSTDTLTIVRAQESTVAQSWLAGDLAANLWTAGQAAAMQQSGTIAPARSVVPSGSPNAFTLSTSDAYGGVGVRATAAWQTTLPNGSTNGQWYDIEDELGNFNQFPGTVFPSTGTTILGETSWGLNVNYQSARFRLYTDNNIWTLKI